MPDGAAQVRGDVASACGAVRIADCRGQDVALLERALPAGRAHAVRYARAVELGRDFLVAWVGARPVGTAVVRWDGFGEEANRAALGPLPEIAGLHVAEPLRGQGIGSALLAEAERRVLARGLTRSSLGVAVDNPRALALYLRHGYVDTGLRSEHTYVWTDADGVDHEVTETDMALVKELR